MAKKNSVNLDGINWRVYAYCECQKKGIKGAKADPRGLVSCFGIYWVEHTNYQCSNLSTGTTKYNIFRIFIVDVLTMNKTKPHTHDHLVLVY